VLVSLEGEVKLCDFGIAHANEAVDAHAMGEALVGKAGYMAPEHARGEQVDARAYVFAAGVILWELLSGKRMYRKGESATLLEVAKAGEIPPFEAAYLPDFERIKGIVEKALAPNREERFPTAQAFQKELEAWARPHRLLGSPLRLGEWLTETFGTEYVERRRERERRVRELEEESRVVTLAQLEAEDRVSRNTIPDNPNEIGSVIVVVEEPEPEPRASIVETAPVTLPRTAVRTVADAPSKRFPWAALAVMGAIAAAAAAVALSR
jgi:serine/threonine protein kinase